MHQLEGEKGVLCFLTFAYLSNLQRYEEAAQYMLDALVLQDSDGIRDNRGVTSSALWQSLKTCCLHMERSDLAVMCDKQNLEGPFG
jgi:peroxin-5